MVLDFNFKNLKLEGQLFKFTNIVTGYKYRYFVVNTELVRLDYFIAEDMKHQKPRGSIELENGVISPSEEDSTTFQIHTIDNELFKLRAQNAKERQQWVNVLRIISQSDKSTDSTSKSDSTRSEILKSPSQIIQNEKCTFELVKEVLAQVKCHQTDLDKLINLFPVKSSLISRHDKDILLLKATARACTNCVSECCNIIRSIQNKKLISNKSIGIKKQLQNIEKKTDIKQNINVYNGAKSDYVATALPRSSGATLPLSKATENRQGLNSLEPQADVNESKTADSVQTALVASETPTTIEND